MDRTPVKGPRPQDPLMHNAAAARREAILAQRNNRRRPNAHFIGVNEYDIPIPSDKIENYVPGLENSATYTMNNFRTGDPVKAYAQRQMNKAKANYERTRRIAQVNNANRRKADPSWRPKRSKTERKRKTRRKNY